MREERGYLDKAREQIRKFKMWFVEPIEELKKLPDGAGGIVALIVGLALYQRLIHAKLKLSGEKTDEGAVKSYICIDLHITDYERKIFWDTFRIGLMHQAMPKKGDTGYLFHNSLSAFPEFREINGQKIICIDPWKFTDRVMNEFLQKPELIYASDSFPLPDILPK
jgi:hypothetical protein